jgi:hypothetical protein
MSQAWDCWPRFHHHVLEALQRRKPMPHSGSCHLETPHQASPGLGSDGFDGPMRCDVSLTAKLLRKQIKYLQPLQHVISINLNASHVKLHRADMFIYTAFLDNITLIVSIDL